MCSKKYILPLGFSKLLSLSRERGPSMDNIYGQTNYSFFCKANSANWISSTTGDNLPNKNTISRIQHCEVHIKTSQLRNKATPVPLYSKVSSFNAEYYRHFPTAGLCSFAARETRRTGRKPGGILVRGKVLQERREF